MDSPTNSKASNNPIEEEGRKSRSPSVDPINEQGMMEEAPQPLDQDHDLREYGCKFCDKKFSNKQALGGHQNAHKVERSIEKTNSNSCSLGYYAAAPSNPPPVLGPYQRNDLLNRAYINWPYPAHQHQYYAARPVMQMGEAYGPRPVYNNVCQGWNQVPAARLPYNPNYLNQGGYIGFQAAAGFPGPLRLGPDRNPVINFANLRNSEEIDEAGLDLRLRL